MSNVDCRIKEFFLFYLLKIPERSDIHNSSIVIHHSSFPEVSYEVHEWDGKGRLTSELGPAVVLKCRTMARQDAEVGKKEGKLEINGFPFELGC
jgi:hypothetical protein